MVPQTETHVASIWPALAIDTTHDVDEDAQEAGHRVSTEYSRPESKEHKHRVGFVHISYHSRDLDDREDEFRLAVGFDAEEVDKTNHDEEDGDPCSVESDIVNLDFLCAVRFH